VSSGCGFELTNDIGRVLSSQTIGVEFASKIVRVGTGARRKRVKLQLWDTAGTERFRSVSRSYYRGAAGAILIYDVSSRAAFNGLSTFLNDAKALASPHLITILAGNKADLTEDTSHTGPPLLDASLDPSDASVRTNGTSRTSLRSKSSNWALGSANTATIAPEGREVSAAEASMWASQNRIPVSLEVSALSGDNVDEIFERLARMLLTKIEIGEIDPDDPQSGIQYGDIGGYDIDNSSIRSGVTDGSGVRRRRRGGGGALRDWEEVFSLDRRRRGCC
jgi:GTPase SAR1 family protein